MRELKQMPCGERAGVLCERAGILSGRAGVLCWWHCPVLFISLHFSIHGGGLG